MEYRDEIIEAVRDEARFVRLTFSTPHDTSEAQWKKITVRPIRLAAGRIVQAVFQGPQKQSSRNLAHGELKSAVEEFLAMGFRHIEMQCTDGDLHIRITRKGKALVSRGRPSVPAAEIAEHDHVKSYPLPANKPDAFLEAVGVMRNGRVRASMQDKFRQINRFLELLSHTRLLRKPPDGTIRVVDCGCGRAFLTFAAYHYLRHRQSLEVRLVGVDADEDVIASARALRDRLGYDDLDLICARIADFDPPAAPDVVFSLHACDTATDEAIARAVTWGARLILSVPCCQHELHRGIDHPAFRAALRHGILRERMADLLTDALRAAALRVMGYRAEVIEFISPTDTAKNLMIRAEKTRQAPYSQAVHEYLRLRDFWRVQPCIERLLGDPFIQRLSRSERQR